MLNAVCRELFGHIVESAMDKNNNHGLYSNLEVPQSVFRHLLQHLQENDNNILGLLSCESNDIFLRYFKDSLNELVQTQFVIQNRKQNLNLPQDFLVNHISGSFVEMVFEWLKNEKNIHLKNWTVILERLLNLLFELEQIAYSNLQNLLWCRQKQHLYGLSG